MKIAFIATLLAFSSIASAINCKNLVEANLVTELTTKLATPYTRISYRVTEPGKPAAKYAVFDVGQYSKEMDAELSVQGFNGVVVRNPDAKEILNRADFHLVPIFFRWVNQAPKSEEAWITSMPSSQARNQLKRKLAASQSIRHNTAPLTLEDYSLWRTNLFEPEMLSRNGAIPIWPEVKGFAGMFKIDIADGNLNKPVPGFSRTFFYDAEGNLVGGILISNNPSDKSLTIRAAAFENQARIKYELAIRGFSLLIQEANKIGYELVSYGQDVSPYGVDTTLGLLQFKTSLGLRPVTVPGDGGTTGFELLKVFDSLHANLGRKVEPASSYQGLVTFAVAGSGQERVDNLGKLVAIQNANGPTGPNVEIRVAAFNQFMKVVQIGFGEAAPAPKIPNNLVVEKIP